MRWVLPALFGLLLCSCSLRLPVEPYPESAATNRIAAKKKEKIDVWMHADKYHTGMIFDYDWLIDSGYIAPPGLGSPKYVVVSWGNTDAYSENGIGSIPIMAQVLFTPTKSVMELIGFDRSAAEVMPQHRLWKGEFPVPRGLHLAHFLNQCSQMDENGKPVIVRPSSWGEGVQVEGRFNYFIPRVCNIWTAQAIEALGGEIQPLRATTPNSLVKQILKEENGFTLIHDGINSN